MILPRISLFTLTCGALLAASGFGVQAQMVSPTHCATRSEILKQLSSIYREAPVAVGIADNGSLLEVLAANDGATWSVLVTRSNGMSCVMLSGQDWQSKPAQSLAGLPSINNLH